MKTEIIQTNADLFKPIEIKITIQSKRELEALFCIANACGGTKIQAEIVIANRDSDIAAKEIDEISQPVFEVLNGIIHQF